MTYTIKPETLDGPDIAALMQMHADLMLSLSPPGSCHFLPLEGLRRPDVSVWSLYDGERLVGSGGLKDMGNGHGEIKAMHTLHTERGRGLGELMLLHIMDEARARGMTHLFLETGAPDGFIPARKLYEKHGFESCGPFCDYQLDPYSVFMSRVL